MTLIVAISATNCRAQVPKSLAAHPHFQRSPQRQRQEADQDVRLDSLGFLMKDGSQAQIALGAAECRFACCNCKYHSILWPDSCSVQLVRSKYAPCAWRAHWLRSIRQATFKAQACRCSSNWTSTARVCRRRESVPASGPRAVRSGRRAPVSFAGFGGFPAVLPQRSSCRASIAFSFFPPGLAAAQDKLLMAFPIGMRQEFDFNFRAHLFPVLVFEQGGFELGVNCALGVPTMYCALRARKNSMFSWLTMPRS